MNCACCGNLVRDEPVVNCSVCKKLFLPTCVDLNRTEVRKINTNKGLIWSCKDCMSLGNDLMQLKSVIVGLQDEIKALKSLHEERHKQASPLMMTEEIIQEVMERDRRRNNVMVFGVPEGRFDSKDQQITADGATLADMFGVLEAGAADYRLRRVGKYDPSKTNLRKAKILKTVDRFSRVFISRDRTPFQTKLYRSVRDELDARIADGESDLRIKYKNDVPQIVALN